MKTYLIFIIQAYQSESPQGQLSDVTSIEVINKSADQALKQARDLIKKKFYRISNIIERNYGEN